MTENEISFQGEKYISSSRASEISGYAKDYIGQLCRGNEIKCQRVGRGWFINTDDLFLHIKKSPRRNHKKLNKEIIQISSKWTHFLSWGYSLSRFKFNFAKYKESVLPALGLIFIIAMAMGFYTYGKQVAGVTQTLSKEIYAIIYAIYENPTKITDLITQEINIAGDSLTSFSISASNETIVFVNKTSQDPFYISYLINRTLSSLNVSAKNNLATFGEDVKEGARIAGEIISGWGRSVEKNIVKNIVNIKQGFAMFPQNLKEIVGDFFDIYKEKTIVVKEKGYFEEPKARDGLVVIPGAKDEDYIKTIKDSFSDEIIVKPDDEIGDSGIIQPVFRKGKGDEYIYIMVPAKEQKVETINN